MTPPPRWTATAAVLMEAAKQVADAVLRLPSALRRDTADARSSVYADRGLNALAHRANGTGELASKGDSAVGAQLVKERSARSPV